MSSLATKQAITPFLFGARVLLFGQRVRGAGLDDL